MIKIATAIAGVVFLAVGLYMKNFDEPLFNDTKARRAVTGVCLALGLAMMAGSGVSMYADLLSRIVL